MKRSLACALVCFLCLFASAQVKTPSQFLGFEVGADRKLADYHQITDYFRYLASQSPRIQVEVMGKSTNGNDFILAAISTEENMKNLARYKEIARKLADPRGLNDQQIDDLVRQGKAVALVTCNIHATEIASSQMAMEWAHALVTATDPETQRRLSNVILLVVPSLNPDGQIMETEWYRKWLGTKYEGGRMPWLYHPYVGHDDNRDWYMLTQKETKAMTRAAYHEWFPQVWVDEHQQGSSGPRLFVPPYTDPISAAVDPLMWRGINVIGTTMAWRLEQQHKAGVAYGYTYDQYFPGAAEGTPEFKNIFGMLTEAASARLATPLELPNSELSGGGKGLIDYEVTANMPNPWPGGTWRLRDIMDYERIASDAMLETVADHAADYMRGTAAMAQHQIASGRPGEYWVIRLDQRDPVAAARLAHLLQEHGGEVLYSAAQKAFLVPTAQPYGKFIRDMLSRQRYPEVHPAQNAPILRPYDITAWTLPLLMGVEVSEAAVPAIGDARPITDTDWPQAQIQGDATNSAVFVVKPFSNATTLLLNAVLKNKGGVSVAKQEFQAGGVTYPAGTLLFSASPDFHVLATKYHVSAVGLPQTPQVAKSALHEVRVGLYKPWTSSMDEGWTRWILEQYDFNLKNIDNKTMKAGNLKAAFDTIILPDMGKEIIVEGRPRMEGGGYFEELPPDYTGGIGKEGVKALKDFVAAGGTLITFASAGDLISDEFNLPVRNALNRVPPNEFSCPGSILSVHLDTTQPVNYGMPENAAIFVNEAIAYQTGSPAPDIQRQVIAQYPPDSEDILMSGWINGADRLTRRAAAVTFTQSKGHVVMFGFRVQNRAQTEGTFKMLFNAIQWAGMD